MIEIGHTRIWSDINKMVKSVQCLCWDAETNSAKEAGIGSRLKTPVLPIWVSCVNGEYGVLFNPNKDLMKSYSAENR